MPDLSIKVGFRRPWLVKKVFRWDTRRHNLAEANAPTSFAQRVKDFALKGNEFYIVTGIREK